MASQWSTWLQYHAAAGKGGVTLAAASRDRIHKLIFNLTGDWTGATLRGQLRASPDAPGSPLAEYAISGPVVAGGVTTFTCRLEPADFVGIPADSDLDGVEELPFDFLLTPSGGEEELFFAGVLPVTGRITA